MNRIARRQGLAVDIPRNRKRNPLRRLALVSALVVAIGSISIALRWWRALPPTIDRASIQIGVVTRGTLVRTVQGPGVLESAEFRWLSATHAGRVEKLPLRPGAAVSADTLLVEMSNPDIELQLLDTERQLAAFRLERLRRARELATLVLGERAGLVGLVGEQREAQRRWNADGPLGEAGYVARLDLERTESRVSEMDERVQWAIRRIEVLEHDGAIERSAEEGQLRALEQMARFRRSEKDALEVRAGMNGVLQSLPIEPGQWVVPGTVLGKVARADVLKAVLRISEVQARDLLPGQPTSVDTRHGVVEGEVALVAPAAHDGTVEVEVRFAGALPAGVRADARVDGTIVLESLPGVLILPRPSQAQPNARLTLFKIEGDRAIRVPVELGAASASAFQVRGGAAVGDRFILTDMSRWDGTDRLSLIETL